MPPAGARLRGATRIIAVDHAPERLAMAKRLGADHLVDNTARDPIIPTTGGERSVA